MHVNSTTVPNAYAPRTTSGRFSKHEVFTLCTKEHRSRVTRLHASASSKATNDSQANHQAAKLLDRFWQARGVADVQQRQKLVSFAASIPEGAKGTQHSTELPGINDYWMLEDDASTVLQVAEASQRLLQLQQLLGPEEDVDIVWMLVREPGLLAADMSQLSDRLMVMRLAAQSTNVNVLKIVEDHPCLLLQKTFALDQQEDEADRVSAWQHGLVSDGTLHWQKRCLQLAQYALDHGDAHIGYRDNEDSDLVRWARKQRYAYKQRTLLPDRASRLQQLGFELDDEAAEWMRWFNEAKLYRMSQGHSCPGPLTTGSSFVLTNWCSVQRVAKKAGVLLPSRESLLDDIGFDWTCADALS
ncbi:hypothetical protein ABBQ32_002253 [Trebouxia sp. C0010 RCD-2024]